MKTAKGCTLFAIFTLAFVIGLFTSVNAAPSPPAFTWVVVKSNATTSETQLSFGAKLSGFSPLSSGSVTVTWPDGVTVTTLGTSDLYYDAIDASYYWKSVAMPSPAPAGDFVFRVSNSLGSNQKTFAFANNPVSIVSNASMAPADLTFTGTTTPTFTWSPVTIPGKTTYYRVEIYDWQRNNAFYTSDRFSSTANPVSFTVPAGALAAGTHYQWRVQAGDDPDGKQERNRSRSNFQGFYTGTQLTPPELSSTIFRATNTTAGLQYRFGTQFEGTFPSQVTSCSVTSPANNINHTFNASTEIISDTTGTYFWKTLNATTPQNDTVTYTLTNAQGTDTDTRAFSFALVPIVDINSIRVNDQNLGNNAYIGTLTPTFEWDPVTIPNKTTYYRAQLSDWYGRIMIFSTPRQLETSFTVPAGVLMPESSYRLVIRPTDGGGSNPESNESVSNVYYFTTVNGEGPASISGYVYQIDGVTPIGGATIELLTNGVVQQTTTATDGSYNLKIAAGSYRIRASAPGYAREYYNNVTASLEATTVNAESGTTTFIDFDLNEGGSISGKIYGSAGAPLSGANVLVRPSLYIFDAGFLATTAADGSYAITGLALGQYKVNAEADGYAKLRYHDNLYGWSNATPVNVSPPLTTADIDITLQPEGRIEGYVWAADGVTPLAAGLVADPTIPPYYEGIGGSTDASGRYLIKGLPPNSYILRATSSGWYSPEYYNSRQILQQADTIPVAVGITTSGINFTLEEGGAVTGHAYDAATGLPVAGLMVSAQRVSDGGWTPSFMTTGFDGSYQLNLPPGLYHLGISDSPLYQAEFYNNVHTVDQATAVPVQFKTLTGGIDLYLDKLGSVSGKVFEADGTTPISGASIYAFPAETGLLGNGKNTGLDGSYTIDGLRPGTYAVFASASGHVSENLQATVVGIGNTPNINFSLETYPYTVVIVGQGVVGSAGGSVGVTDPNSEIASAGIIVPSGALGQSTVVTVGQVTNAPPFPLGTGAIGSAIHFGPEGLGFAYAVTLKLPYTDAQLQAAGVTDPNALDVYTFNTAINEWQIVADPIEVDEVNKLILVHVFHFSIYRLGYDIPPCFGQFDADTDVDGSDLWHFIAGGSFADIAQFAASFGRTNCP